MSACATRVTLVSLAVVGLLACASAPGTGTPRSCEGTWVLTVTNPGDLEYQVYSGDKVIGLVGRGTHTFTVATAAHYLKRVTGDRLEDGSTRRGYATSRVDCKPH